MNTSPFHRSDDMNKIFIKKTPNADTRSMKELDKTLVRMDTVNHIAGVKDVMSELGEMMKAKGRAHDITKLRFFPEFFRDLSTKKTGDEFKKLPWWKMHLIERHHLNDRCPADVNLLDVIEMLVDGVCAGKARTGTVYPIELSNEMLQKALYNTQKMLEKNIEVWN